MSEQKDIFYIEIAETYSRQLEKINIQFTVLKTLEYLSQWSKLFDYEARKQTVLRGTVCHALQWIEEWDNHVKLME